jgi:hypothetical protein
MTDYVAFRLLLLGAVLGLLFSVSWSGLGWGVASALIVGAYAIRAERKRLTRAQK